MKKLGKLFAVAVLLFVILFVCANLLFSAYNKERNDKSDIYMNRFFYALQERTGSPDADKIEADITDLLRNEDLKKEAALSGSGLPERVYYIPAENGNSEVSLLNREDNAEKIWALHNDDSIIGFVVFEFNDPVDSRLRILMNVCLLIAFIITLGICVYINTSVLRPFGKLASYPEKMSKNEISGKLPETKNRLFGRFIWGINMLSDRLENNKKRINALSKEHMTMMTTIAHGIKTPVANIKLYADAISTGLYQPDGKVNEKDAEVAAKISRNADDVAELVKELIDKASGGIVDFEPHIESFYLNELEEFLKEEFGNRMKMLRIPLSIETGHNAIIKSDKSGICRMLSQLMENALKYGNGGAISVCLDKESDGYYFAVKNKGEVPDENELPYLFNSFWRGSNAADIPGSGIGLFEAREIARKLYGDIYVKADPEKKEMEFDIFIPGGNHSALNEKE